jgi:hypothetical protein
MTAFDRAPGSEFVLVTAVGEAEGSRTAAAALACAGADVDRAALLVDVGGRAPRPTLIASSAAQRLEERLTVHLPSLRVAARGQVCHLAVGAEPESFEIVSVAATVARESLVVLHLPAALVQSLLDQGLGARLTGAMLRAEIAADRALLALVVGDLRARGLAVGVLKRRLGWVAERRALFGALGPDVTGGLPASLSRRLLSHECYAESNDPGANPTRAAQPEWRDHASTGSR